MVCVPLRCGNSNRADLQQIATSLTAQRGDAITTQVGSIMWVETQAWARAIYHVWAYNQKLTYQFDPNKMTDFLPRWETIMGLAALPTDTIQDRQKRIASRFALINKIPDTQNVTDLLKSILGITFLEILNNTVSSAYAQFPGGAPITGGITNIVNGPWYSTMQEIFIEVRHPPQFTDNQFYNIVNQIFPVLGAFLPAYDTFDWFWSSFSDDGYSSTTIGTISVTVGTTALTGTGTKWHTLINADGTYNLVPGSIIEGFDDTGIWQRMVVGTVNSDTSITLAHPSVATFTNRPYVIQGFFCDCDATQFPYPPANAHNLDNAGLNSV